MRKPWLWLPPKLAHDLLPWALPIAAKMSAKSSIDYQPRDWRGLKFKNPLGIAGGVDKSGQSLLSWQRLGCGFLEVGTITPVGQEANPGRIVDRSYSHKAVWNKMGFPNQGAEVCRAHLQKIKPHIKVPLLINIGKNRSTENADAHKDYIRCLDVLKEHADAFVINISSPNTQGLRDLSNQDYLKTFLTPIVEHKNRAGIQQPLLMKLSPDMHESELENLLDTSLSLGIDGWILTNTTASRPTGIPFPKEGGMSGAPLKSKSVDMLKVCLKHLGPRRENRLVISAGGISNAADAQERLQIGADLVQIYSALIFEGPWLFQNMIRDLRKQQ